MVVAPSAFRGTVGGLVFDWWVPLATESGMGDLSTRFESRGRRWLQTIARLSNGVSLRRAQVGLDTVGQRLAREFPETNKAGNILWLVLRQGLLLVAVGVGIGAAVGFGVSLLIASLLVGVSGADLTTWLLVPMVLVTAVLAACWFPVRRAVRFNPLPALRCE